VATLVLPKDTEFADGNTARGTDVRANDQAIRDFINNANLDGGNFNLASNITWTGIHSFTQNNLKIGSNVLYPDTQIGAAVINMKLGISSGVLKIVGHNGSDLSSSNPGIVVSRDGTGGFTSLLFTSSPSFGDSTASDSDFVGTGTWSWGTTAGVAWANDMPLLIGVCTDGTTPVAVLGRVPVSTTGASTNIGYQDNAPSSADQKNVGAMTVTNVTATHANKAITWIGSLRIQKNSSDNWTYTALGAQDGICNFFNFGCAWFTFPLNQNGAAAGSVIKANGGTVPIFTTNNAFYRVDMGGLCYVTYFLNSDGGTDGAGAVDTQLSFPYTTNSSFSRGSGTLLVVTPTYSQICIMVAQGSATGDFFISRNNSTTTTTAVQLVDFANGTRQIQGSFLFGLDIT
jgi:hypothetical protein